MVTEKQYKAIVLDCDGVVFDVNQQKSEAFVKAVAQHPPEIISAFIKRHKETGGVSRYEKFRYFYTELCPSDDTEEAIEAALVKYARIVKEAYRQILPHPSALAFAKHFFGRLPVFIASGSDQEELRDVFRFHSISPMFQGVYGSPTVKQKNVEKILSDNNLVPEEVVFVGDGGGDYRVTFDLGMPFVYLGEMAEWKPSPTQVEDHPNINIFFSWRDVLEYFHVPA